MAREWRYCLLAYFWESQELTSQKVARAKHATSFWELGILSLGSKREENFWSWWSPESTWKFCEVHCGCWWEEGRVRFTTLCVIPNRWRITVSTNIITRRRFQGWGSHYICHLQWKYFPIFWTINGNMGRHGLTKVRSFASLVLTEVVWQNFKWWGWDF